MTALHSCPDEFKEFLKSLSVKELAVITNDLRRSPEDKKYLDAALIEMRWRQRA